VHRRPKAEGLDPAASRWRAKLLVLDTATGGHAENLNARMGWTKLGVIPGFAMYPDEREGTRRFFGNGSNNTGLYLQAPPGLIRGRMPAPPRQQPGTRRGHGKQGPGRRFRNAGQICNYHGRPSFRECAGAIKGRRIVGVSYTCN